MTSDYTAYAKAAYFDFYFIHEERFSRLSFYADDIMKTLIRYTVDSPLQLTEDAPVMLVL
jgi:hypothetical protein